MSAPISDLYGGLIQDFPGFIIFQLFFKILSSYKRCITHTFQKHAISS